MELEARLPHAPKVSTSRDTKFHSLQIPEFSSKLVLFLAAAAEPAVCPTSETMSGFNRDDTERSKAADLQMIPQLLTRISAGVVCFASWPRPLPASKYGLNEAV